MIDSKLDFQIYLIFVLRRSYAKKVFIFCRKFTQWKLRLGSQNLSVSEDALFLDIKSVNKHPLFDNKTSYFDVAILETEPVELNEVVETYFTHWIGRSERESGKN